MTKPRITLQQVLDAARAEPASPEMELAALDFQELPDSEQKDILFRAICHQGAQINWLLAKFDK